MTSAKFKFPINEYINFDYLGGTDAELALQSVKIRKAQKQHSCIMESCKTGKIEPGEYYRFEKALVDSDFFGTYKICIPCIDAVLSEYEDEDEDF